MLIVCLMAGFMANASTLQDKELDSLIVDYILRLNNLDTVPVSEVAVMQGGRVVHLDLSGRGITEIPPEIGQLESLNSLFLGNNPLSSLPDTLGSMDSLIYLDASLTLLDSLPKTIGDMLFLSYLDLSYSKLKVLPRQTGLAFFLRQLMVSGNLLTTLPKELQYLQDLAILTLADNQLENLPEEITILGSLDSLDLTANHICNPSSSIQKWADTLHPGWRASQLCNEPNRLTIAPHSIYDAKRNAFDVLGRESFAPFFPSPMMHRFESTEIDP